MDTRPPVDWRARAVRTTFDGRAFIDGQRVAAADEATFDTVSPIDGWLLTRVARGRAADIDRAVAAARRAFADRRWCGQAPAERKKVLQRFAQGIEQHREQLALLDTLDMGKPIRHALGVDIPLTVRCIAWYAEAADKLYDEIAPTPASGLALITREPMGVIGAIIPWNYPLVMAAWKIGPALAAGNSVVLKPSEKASLSALRLAEIAREAGLPDGVFNVVPGHGPEAGEALALHMDVDAIGFTGSTRVGRQMLECAGRSNLKRVFNELGGKSAFVVFDDFRDLERAAVTAAGSLFFNQGQSCNAPSRAIVHEAVADRFTEIVAAEAARLQPADPLDEATEMGAIVDEAQLASVLGHIEAGRAEGATLVAGGARVRQASGGCYVEPTVFADVDNRMHIAQQEIFGPVLSVIRFKTEEQAIALANDNRYGLQASVWSDHLSRAHRVARALRAGTVHVNQYDEDDITVPFGGYGQSGNGRDKSLHAFDKVTELKTTWLRIDPS